MIEVKVVKPLEDIFIGKNGTFIKGVPYFARISKNSNSILVRSQEGYWKPILRFKHGYTPYLGESVFTRKGFSPVATIYMKNRKRLNQFETVQEYLSNEENYKKWYYSSIFKDIEFYK